METQILLWLHELAHPALDTVFYTSHVVGGLYANVVLVSVVTLWLWLRGERREAAVWLVLGLTALVVELGLKPLLGRSRPELWPRLVEPRGASFPSGHAFASATFYPLLASVLSRRTGTPFWGWLFLAAAAALTVGVGRLYLGVHWPSDVLAGWFLGAVLTFWSLRALEGRS